MEKPKTKKRTWKRVAYGWTKEEDDLLRYWSSRGLSMRAVTEKVNAFTGKPRSESGVRARAVAIGAIHPIERGPNERPTQDMLDYLFVNRDVPLAKLTKDFNARYGRHWTPMKIYKAALEGHASGTHINAKVFREEWEKLQDRWCPNGRIRGPHWLWRSKRIDETRTAAGIVLRGKKEDITMPDNVFASEWKKMQGMYGVDVEKRGGELFPSFSPPPPYKNKGEQTWISLRSC